MQAENKPSSATSRASHCYPTVEVYSQDAEAGKWYEHPTWGKILCCGTTGGDWIMSFAVRTNTGRTVMKYVHDKRIKESRLQSWETVPDCDHDFSQLENCSKCGIAIEKVG